jgi:hypothetical protein
MQFSEKFSVVLEKKVLHLFRTFHFKIWHALSLADQQRIVPGPESPAIDQPDSSV